MIRHYQFLHILANETKKLYNILALYKPSITHIPQWSLRTTLPLDLFPSYPLREGQT